MKKLRRVEKWTKGKASFPALASAWLVMGADDLHASMVCQAIHKRYAKLFTIENMTTWSTMYQGLFEQVSADFASDSSSSFLQEHLLDILSELDAGPSVVNSPGDLNHHPIIDIIRHQVLNDFHVTPDESSINERLLFFQEALQNPSLVFAMKVFAPSLILYQSTPLMLLKRALEGDIESLARLASIDKNLLSLPDITPIWEPISRDPSSVRFKTVTNAISRAPLKTLRPMRVKTALAIAIEFLFKCFGEPLPRTQIRGLFDAYARDVHGTEIDEDLPGTENGFDAAIRLERNRWLEAVKTTPTL